MFSRNRMVGKLSKEETQTFTFIRGADIGNLTIPLGANRHAAFKKVTSVTEITPDISSSNSLTIDVSVDIEANLVEAFPHREIGWQEKKEIESKTEELIKEDIKNLISKLQGLNTDPVGFGDKVRINYPREWENKYQLHHQRNRLV